MKGWTPPISWTYDLPMRRIPPMAAVRVFEAAARHENFTAAATELGMTQAAVSYQVKLLEERLGGRLFRRERGRVALSEPGRRIASRLAQAFDDIDAAFASLRADDESLLTISTSNTFANAWLVWRLGAFQLANQKTGVRLLTSDALTDFAREDTDVAIRSGQGGGWPGLRAEKLLDVDFTPMCSPAFLAAQGGAIGPADLPRLPQIGSDDPWWAVWLRQAGIAAPEAPALPALRLDSQAHQGNAAIAGQGVAMLTPFFWRQDMADGRLVRLFETAATRGYGYWLVYPEHRHAVPKIRRFREWLTAEVERDRVELASG